MGGVDLGGRFIIKNSNTDTLALTGNITQDFGPFLNLEIFILKVFELWVILRYCRGHNNQGAFRLCINKGYFFDTLLETDSDSFSYQICCQFGFCPVITCHLEPFNMKITCQGTHTDTSNPKKIILAKLIHFFCFMSGLSYSNL